MLALDGLDGKQARRLKNSTVVGELLDHTVDIVSLFVITRISTIIFGIRDIYLLPQYIIIGSVFCMSHYHAYIDQYLALPKYTGPNEMLIYTIISYLTTEWLPWGAILGSELAYRLAMLIFISATTYICYLSNDSQQNYLLNLAMARCSFILLISLYLSKYVSVSYLQIICIFILINVELIVAKMAQTNVRNELHIYCMACLVNQWIALLIMLYTAFSILKQMKDYFGYPMFSVFKGNNQTKKYIH